MYVYSVNSIVELRRYIARGIAPGKTLRFEINTVPVVVSLDRDEVYHVKFSGSRRCHYSFENLMFDLGLIFDAVMSSVA